jgi:hypothetical protein
MTRMRTIARAITPLILPVLFFEVHSKIAQMKNANVKIIPKYGIIDKIKKHHKLKINDFGVCVSLTPLDLFASAAFKHHIVTPTAIPPITTSKNRKITVPGSRIPLRILCSRGTESPIT